MESEATNIRDRELDLHFLGSKAQVVSLVLLSLTSLKIPKKEGETERLNSELPWELRL